MKARTKEQAQRRLNELDKRLGKARGASKERSRLHRIIKKGDTYAPIWEPNSFKPVDKGHIGKTEGDFKGAIFKTQQDLL